MKRLNDVLSKAQIWSIGTIGILCAFLILAAASAQQDRRTDKSSGRGDTEQRSEGRQADKQQPQSTQNQNLRTGQNRDATRSVQPQARERAQPRDQQTGERVATRSTQTGFRQRFGLQLDRAAQGQSGVAITEVQPGTPAAQAGLRSGDRLLTIDGRNLTSPQQFFAYLSGQYGREVPVVILRDGQQYTVQLAPDNNNDDTAWLGVYLNDSDTAQGGAEVAQVYPAGPAARAGLMGGDVITQIDGQAVSGAADLISAIEEQQAGARVKLVLRRNNQQIEIPVTLGSRDSFVYRGQGEESWGGRHDDRSYGENDQFSNLPPFAMQLEHERRMYEQHQRIETEITKLQDEIRQLRELTQQQQRR